MGQIGRLGGPMEALISSPESLDRDSWTTPQWLTDLLPYVDLDPCSNVRSTVRANRTYRLDRGEDGLALPWNGMCFINPPYSDVLPWARKGIEAESIGFLVNADSSTAWWREMTRYCRLMFLFAKRIQFTPPPGVRASTNSKPQALVCDEAFWDACSPELVRFGQLWRRV